MAEEFSITRSLFGLDPRQAADASRFMDTKRDSDEAYRMAQLTPEQQATYLASRGGAMAGRGVVDLAGGLMGVDTAPRSVKLAQATQAIMRQLQSEGYDPNDTFGIRKEMATRLAAAGFGQEATMLAQEVQNEALAQGKLRAETAAKYAGAAKDVMEAKRTPGVRFAETGKYTPESIAKYEQTGNVSDLQNIPGWKTVETGDGVFLVPEGLTALDANNRKTRVGDSSKGGENKVIAKAQGELKALVADNLRGGETVDEMLLRLERDNPKARLEIIEKARLGYGTENWTKALGTRGNPTENVLKLMVFVPRAMREYENFKKSFDTEYGGKSPLKLDDIKDTLNIIRQINTNNPGEKISSTMVLNQISDPRKRKFITDAMSVFYPDVRLQTGAAIVASEWQIALEQMLPYADDPDNGKFKLNRMRDNIKDQYKALESTDEGARYISRNKLNWDFEKKEEGAPKSADLSDDDKQLIRAAKAATDKAAYFRSLTPAQQARLRELTAKK